MHVVAPVVECFPTAQSEQEALPLLPWYFPAGHDIQLGALAPEYLPAAHREHEVAPFVEENLPLGQVIHVPSDAYLPKVHWEQLEEPSGDGCPAGHCLQLFWPNSSW